MQVEKVYINLAFNFILMNGVDQQYWVIAVKHVTLPSWLGEDNENVASKRL